MAGADAGLDALAGTLGQERPIRTTGVAGANLPSRDAVDIRLSDYLGGIASQVRRRLSALRPP